MIAARGEVADPIFGDRERMDFAIDPALAHPARDQLGDLAAEIEDQDAVGHGSALENGDKEAVGAVPRRGQPQIIARRPARRRRSSLPRRARRAAARNPARLRERLRPAPRPPRAAASRSRKSSRPPGRTRRAALRKICCWRSTSSARSSGPLRHLASGLRRHVPVPRHGTSTKTRSKLPLVALDPFVALAGQRAALDIVDPGAAQPARRAVEAAGRYLAGDELAAIGHSGGERQGLAARPGAEIDDPHPGPRIGEQRGNLRAFVLHFDEALLERGEIAERHPFAQPQADWRQRVSAPPPRLPPRARGAPSSRSAFSRLTRRSVGAGPLSAAISRSSSLPKTRSR